MSKTQNTAVAQNTVADVMNAHITALTQSQCKALDNYNIVADSELEKDSVDDTYLHVFRHDTDSSLNVVQCFYKHNKKQVYMLPNKAQFEEYAKKYYTLSDSKDNNTYQIAHKSRVRIVVAYDDFVHALESILTYDSVERKAQTSTAKQTASKQTASKQTASKQTASKQTASKQTASKKQTSKAK